MGIKEYLATKKKESIERNAYRKILAEKIKVAERQAYATASEKEARARAVRLAHQKYNAPKVSGVQTFGNVVNTLFGSSTPQSNKVISSKPKYKTTYIKKGKSYIRVRRKIGNRTISSPKQNLPAPTSIFGNNTGGFYN